MKALLSFLLLLGATVATAQAPPQPAAATAQRPLFLIFYRPGPNWQTGRPMREQDLRAHGAYYAQLIRDGRAFAGGGYVGEDGGMAILRAADLAEARAILAADPAIQNGVFAADLRQWQPRFHTEAPLVERPPDQASNPEMRRMFEEDQAPRTNGQPIDWAVLGPQDDARRAQTRRLLDAGALVTADDFYHAAYIFQHGNTADDYLMAHTLATVAVARGRAEAIWIAAAALDRYLMKIGQPQIYGTQYFSRPGEPVTQEPYNRTLVSDALRAALNVPDQRQQETRRQEMERNRR